MKRPIHLLSILLVACFVIAAGSALAQPKADAKKAKPKKTESSEKETGKEQAAKDAEEASSAKPATCTVKKGPFKIEVSLDGHFEARQMTEMIVRTKAWTGLEVVKAVEHGAAVKRGDALVTLDVEKIDDAITAARTEDQVADLTVKMAEADLRLLEAAMPLEREAVESTHKRNDEDFARYYKIELPLSKKMADFSLKMAEEYLEYAREELRQLEKMYKADDLTEETEEIILKRQRRAVKRAEFTVERAKLQYEETLKIRLPRSDEDMKRSAQIENLQYQRVKTVLPLALEKAKGELEKAKLLRAKAREKLEQLTADREAMVVTAPTDGVVYYGRSADGKFTGSDGKPLRRGDSLTPKQVFMTLVKTRPMSVATSVPEDKLHAVKPGLKGTARPKGYPDMKLPAVLAQVAAIPAGEGKFQARVDVTLGKDAAPLMPGMACTVTLVPYLKRDAITVPKTAVETDPLDEQKQFVYLVTKGKEPKKQPVTVGKKTDKLVEVLKGLSPGDKVLTTPPKKK